MTSTAELPYAAASMMRYTLVYAVRPREVLFGIYDIHDVTLLPDVPKGVAQRFSRRVVSTLRHRRFCLGRAVWACNDVIDTVLASPIYTAPTPSPVVYIGAQWGIERLGDDAADAVTIYADIYNPGVWPCRTT